MRFETAIDKTIYHPGGENPAPGSNIEDDDDGEITTKERLTTVYTDEDGKQTTKKWIPEDAIPTPTPSPSNTFTFTAIEGETFIIYCGYDSGLGYQFAFQEIEGGVECPWTYEKRFNIFNTEYMSFFSSFFLMLNNTLYACAGVFCPVSTGAGAKYIFVLQSHISID